MYEEKKRIQHLAAFADSKQINIEQIKSDDEECLSNSIDITSKKSLSFVKPMDKSKHLEIVMPKGTGLQIKKNDRFPSPNEENKEIAAKKL